MSENREEKEEMKKKRTFLFEEVEGLSEKFPTLAMLGILIYVVGIAGLLVLYSILTPLTNPFPWLTEWMPKLATAGAEQLLTLVLVFIFIAVGLITSDVVISIGRFLSTLIGMVWTHMKEEKG